MKYALKYNKYWAKKRFIVRVLVPPLGVIKTICLFFCICSFQFLNLWLINICQTSQTFIINWVTVFWQNKYIVGFYYLSFFFSKFANVFTDFKCNKETIHSFNKDAYFVFVFFFVCNTYFWPLYDFSNYSI